MSVFRPRKPDLVTGISQKDFFESVFSGVFVKNCQFCENWLQNHEFRPQKPNLVTGFRTENKILSLHFKGFL